MAGGMDWFRWHHGSVTDPKFQLVARRSGASLPDVLAVWAYLLELASAADVRGVFGAVDCEAVDCLFGFPATETRTANVMTALDERRLTCEGAIVRWSARQAKREREDVGAADRKREQRERERGVAAEGMDEGGGQVDPAPARTGVTQPVAAGACLVTPDSDRVGGVTSAASDAAGVTPSATTQDHVTPCHATSRQKRPRGEERRSNTNPPTPRLAGGAFARFWAMWPELPTKAAERQCAQRWRRDGLDAEVDAVLAGLQAAVASKAWRKDAGAFVPAPLTWLRQRRWCAPTEAQAAAVRAEAVWHETRSGIEAKGEDLGLGRWDEGAWQGGAGEAWPAYQAKVYRAAGYVPAKEAR